MYKIILKLKQQYLEDLRVETELATATKINKDHAQYMYHFGRMQVLTSVHEDLVRDFK